MQIKMMRIKILSTLCAVACSAFAGQAMAALTGTHKIFVDNVTGDKKIFISGTEALKKGDFFNMVNALLTGPIYFKDISTSNDFQAVAGSLATDMPPWSMGDKVIVIYGAVATSPDISAPASSLNVSSAACDNFPNDLGTGAVLNPYICGMTTLPPDAGVSDIDPDLFHSTYNTEGETAASSPPPDLTGTPIYGLAVGVPVTKSVGASVRLNKANISAIMTGNIGTWDQVASGQTGDIVICRRTPGSATQSVFNMYFGNYPCDVDTAFNVPADRDASSAWNNVTNTYTVNPGTAGLTVIENSTAADVRNCLNRAETGGSYATKDRNGAAVTVTFNGTNHKAIGVLAMDSLSFSSLTVGNGVDGNPNTSDDTGNWQFRPLNGAGTYTAGGSFIGTGRFPTLANYLNGTWDLQSWISFNTMPTTTPGKKAFLARFLERAQDPVWRAGSLVEAGIPGGIYTTGQLLRSVYVNGNQCAPYNRNFGG